MIVYCIVKCVNTTKCTKGISPDCIVLYELASTLILEESSSVIFKSKCWQYLRLSWWIFDVCINLFFAHQVEAEIKTQKRGRPSASQKRQLEESPVCTPHKAPRPSSTSAIRCAQGPSWTLCKEGRERALQECWLFWVHGGSLPQVWCTSVPFRREQLFLGVWQLNNASQSWQDSVVWPVYIVIRFL